MRSLVLRVALAVFFLAGEPYADEIHIPTLVTDHGGINRAFRIAVGDLMGNVALHQSGLLEEERLVILAGLDYYRPWTRDAAINVWNGGSLLMPEIGKNTLLSVLEPTEDGPRIGGQYWDCMVWATGAWHHYLYTGDEAFLKIAFEAVENSLARFEREEFDAETGLFRGPGWSDGVAAYPDAYTAGASSAILDWPKAHPDRVVTPGYGIPMQAISTNCLYYNAYRVAGKMADALGVDTSDDWAAKGDALKAAINKDLWMEDTGHYRFFIGPFGGCDYQEALGHSYAILFGVADDQQRDALFQNTHVTSAGVPCVWPTFARYENAEGTAYGRHSGTVWPQIQGMWADAAVRHGRKDLFAHELLRLTEHANRDQHFAEIYHPDTGEIYGGMQEAGEKHGIKLWGATKRQTWAATAYIRMVLFGLAGMRFDEDGVRFEPCLIDGVSGLSLRNIRYRDMTIDVTIDDSEETPVRCTINGKPQDGPFIKNPGRDN